jgi:hypothetical protein
MLRESQIYSTSISGEGRKKIKVGRILKHEKLMQKIAAKYYYFV